VEIFLNFFRMAASSASSPRVLVTGVSGFIGAWVAAGLLELGFKVRGTVRNASKKPDLSKFLSNPTAHELEVAEADLTSDKGWDEAVKDCTYILHVASPFVLKEPKNAAEAESMFYKPAVEGTLRVLTAASKATPVPKRVVVTSSVAAIGFGHPETRDPNQLFTDSDWNPDGPTDEGGNGPCEFPVCSIILFFGRLLSAFHSSMY
jgi:nucleoside-diphosphate-sugar epimerase